MGRAFTIEAIGQVLRRGAQRYECIEIKPTIRRDGTPTSYAVLQSQCAECKATFTCTSALSGAVFQPNRRCDKHKAAGVPLGYSKAEAIGTLREELRQAKAGKADLQRRLTEATRELQDTAKRLARYELNADEARRFAALCETKAKERRAHLAKAKWRAQDKPSVFD